MKSFVIADILGLDGWARVWELGVDVLDRKREVARKESAFIGPHCVLMVSWMQ